MCVRCVLMLTDKAMLPLFITSSFTFYISVVLQSDELSKTRRLNKKMPIQEKCTYESTYDSKLNKTMR